MRRTVVGPTLLGILTLALSAARVGDAPFDLYRDEAFHAVSAHTLATTGRDLRGRRLPLIIAPDEATATVEAGAPPVLVYAMAAIFTVLPVSEATTRLPALILGVADVLLVYAIGRLLFDRVLLAELAAALVALTPAHFLFSRLALTAQVPVPFVLGWLLCILLYLRRGDAWLLWLAGALLALACAAYFAIMVLVPVYTLLTAGVMYRRQAPVRHYLTFAAGVIVPMLVCVPWLLWDSPELRRIVTHYEWRDPRRGSAIVDAASTYWTFFGPRFLFVDGAPRIEFSTRVAGVFLLATAGVMLVGFIQAVRRMSPQTALVLGGLLTAPIPASLVGEGQAIWRALPIVPFGVLTAVIGLQRFWDTGSDREQRISFVAALASLVALAIYHGQQPYAQAFVRASLVPLTVVGLSVLVGGLDVGPRQLIGAAAVTVVSLLPIQIALFVVDYSVVLDLAPWFAAVLGGVLLLPSAWLARHRLHAPAAIAFLAVVASEFAYFHIERAGLPRLPLIPAGAVLPVTRFAVAFAAVAAAVATAARAEGPSRATIAPLVVLVVIQIAYFRVDYFAGDGARLVHVAAVLLATVWLVVQLGHHVDRRRLAAVTTAAVLTVASLQFAYFYMYYLTSYQQHALSPDGSVRAVMERVIERAGDRPAATVYFWNFGHPGLDDWYWRFYTTKHHRESLAARTIRGEEPVAVAVDRIRDLPEGSLVVTRPSNDLDRAIDRMRGAGYVEETEILRTSDGRPVFWILERRAK